jgi:hypothetical protein
VAVGVNEVEKALTPLGVAGRASWLAPCCERTVVKCISISINIGDVEDHAPLREPTLLGRLGRSTAERRVAAQVTLRSRTGP